MAREDFTFIHSLRVRWAEVDRQDVVFNGHYFFYFDVAIGEYWRAIGLRYPKDFLEGGTDVYAIKASSEFLGSASYDDMLDIGCRAARIGRTSIRFLFEIFRAGELITHGEVVYVNADIATRKSAPLSELVKDAIRAFERVPPET